MSYGTSDSAPLLGITNPDAAGAERSVTAVASSVSGKTAADVAAKNNDLYAKAVAGSLDPLSSDGAWSTFGSAAGRFGPWVALLGLAFVMEAVARSALRDKVRAKTVKGS